jgi:hypothetical protein
MDTETLVQWKTQISAYQQQVRKSKSAQQTKLFDVAPAYCDPDAIDPFRLNPQSIAFWRFESDSPSDACLYFVIDNPLLLVEYTKEDSTAIGSGISTNSQMAIAI